MRLKIMLYGYGRELVIGSIPQDTWNYIQENFHGDADGYFNALDNGDIPEEFRLVEDRASMSDYDDIEHSNACWLDNANIVIEDENCNEIFRLDGKYLRESEIQRSRCKDVVNRGDAKYLSIWISEEKGCWLLAEFEVEDKFDPKKLKLNYSVMFYEDDTYLDGPIVDGLEYDGKEIECWFEDTRGIALTIAFEKVYRR